MGRFVSDIIAMSVGSAALTVLVAVVFRFMWRRGKPFREP